MTQREQTPGRRRWRIAGMALAVLTAVVTLLVVIQVNRHSTTGTPSLDIGGAETKARRACADLDHFQQLVNENARSDIVLRVLHSGQRQAHSAVELDPRWRSLASGTDALAASFRTGSAAAARVGIHVVRGQCSALK